MMNSPAVSFAKQVQAADAMEPTRSSSAFADPHQDPGWHTTSRIRALVPRHDQRQRQGPQTGSYLIAPQNVMLSIMLDFGASRYELKGLTVTGV